MGIKRDKSSSAAAVNSLRAAASYPPGVFVGCFELVPLLNRVGMTWHLNSKLLVRIILFP